MDLSALTILVFGVLIAGSGMTGLLAPQFLLYLLGLPQSGMSSNTTQIFVMAASQASLAMGLYYILAAVNETRIFFQWSLPLRIINFMVFTSLVPFGIAPPQWLLVAGLELIGALATGLALTSRNKFRLERFNALRAVSLILACLGAILAFDRFGVYGSASVFLAIVSSGGLYAYQQFRPSRKMESGEKQ